MLPLKIRIDNSLPSKSQRKKQAALRLLSSFIAQFCFLSLGLTQELRTPIAIELTDVRSLQDLQDYSRSLVAQPYAVADELPAPWSNLSYDEYRKVVFNPDKAIWRSDGAPFFLEAFHRGFVHHDRVMLHAIEGGRTDLIPFIPSMFDYRGGTSGATLTPDFGFAGFRLVGRFPARSDWQEMITFLGASYFRARTAGCVYGASARGLAVDVGLNKAEEFPVFRSYWLLKPVAGATTVTFFALMDSPSVVGAYEFSFAPGVHRSLLDVNATLYFRRLPERIGIAPLTSMWMWGDGLAGPKQDARPEVHDSDALVIHSRSDDQADQWFCRSLMRQNYPSIVDFPQSCLAGFGLVQRDTRSDHYRDNEAKYHLRPSLWVEPTADWGHGSIQLLELPAEHEGIDNIAVWWCPSRTIVPLTAVPLSYRVTFALGDPTPHSLLKVTEHRVQRPKADDKKFAIGLDFASDEKSIDVHDRARVTAVCSGVRCDIEQSTTERNEDGSWTTTLNVIPTTTADPFELKVQLVLDGQPLSETWSYLCPILSPPVALPPWRQKP